MKEAQLKEIEDLKGQLMAVEAELTIAQKERDEAIAISRVFQEFM